MKSIKILIICISLLLLYSCGDDNTGADENTNSGQTVKKTAGLRHFSGDDFSVKIPASWNIVTKKSGVVPIPKNGTLELAITSTETKGGFANNFVVLSQQLQEYISSTDYSIINNVGAENEYINYRKISSKEFIFQDEEKSMLYVFEAKYSENTPMLKFIQTAHICNNKQSFFLTIALATEVKNTAKYEKMLQTFTCK